MRKASSLPPSPKAQATLDALKRAGLKLTAQRVALVRELADDMTHPTAQELYDRLRRAYPAMSFATVYNTLGALARAGLAGSLHLGMPGGPVRFDPNTAPHHHAVCEVCGDVTDIAADPSEAPSTLRLVDGFQVHREERTFHGVCGACAPKRARSGA